jgi:hypothetical protein
VFTDDIKEALEAARQCALKAQDRQAAWANRKRRPVVLKVGDRVLLSTKNLRLRGEGVGKSLRRKLMPRFVGPFTVEAVINEVAYKLHLPEGMKCHPVFHVSLLRAYTTGPYALPPPNPLFFAGEFEWEVERIVDSVEHIQVKAGKEVAEVWYKVRWTGYGEPYDTWEPESHLKNAREVVEAWKKSL